MMKYEEILENLVEFGPYQKRIYFLVCLVGIPHAVQLLGIVFTMASQDHRCAIPGFSNDTYQVQDDWHDDVIDRWIPKDTDTEEYSSCRIFVSDSASHHVTNQTKACSRYVYDNHVFTTTITSDQDLVCESRSLTTYANMIFMAGMLSGSLIMGTLSDIIGRKKILIISVFCHWLSSLSLAFVKSYTLFVVLRFVIAFFGIAVFMTAHVFGIEIVGPKTRLFTGLILELFFVGGVFINALVAYFIRDWSTLQIVTSTPAVILVFCFVFFIPESTRWLIRKGKYGEALEIIKTTAKANKVKLPDKANHLEDIESDDKQASLWQMLSSKVLLIRTLLLMFVWFVISLVYFGLSLNVGALSGNIHLNFVLFGVIEAMACIACLVLLDRVGRKPLMCVSFLVSGVACLGIMFPVMFGGEDISWLTKTLSCAGKFGASMAFGIVYLYTAELFPTSLRNSGIGLCSFTSRIGGIMSPYIADLGQIVSGKMGVALPSIVFGGAAVFAGLLTLLLPETTNRQLPESIQDAKDFGRNPSPAICKGPKKNKEVPLLGGCETEEHTKHKSCDEDLDLQKQDAATISAANGHTVDNTVASNETKI